MKRRNLIALGAAIFTLTVLPACGKAKSSVALKKIGSFDAPVYVAGAPGFPRLLFVVEQGGRIAVLEHGHRLHRPFLDLRGKISSGGERGLLSVAFPPDYASSRRLYVYYTDPAGNIRIDEFRRASPTRAAMDTRRKVIEIPHPVNANHNGGQLQFLGSLLYFGTGDGGSGGDPPNNAQNKDALLGKLLRIDPLPSGGRPYSIPPDNPFVGRPGRDEIYSYGLRNPFRFSFDTTTAKQPRIAIGDVGQNRFEELDYLPVAAAAGANFGWDAFEGFSRYTEENSGTPDPGGTVKPIFAYSHSRAGSCSIIGGYVVRDPRLRRLDGRYLYADLCEGQLRTLAPHLKGAGDDRKLGLHVSNPSSFGEDDRHRLYVASLDGPVYRLVPR
ncbi:MAG TPA: PQQ-dependent sugar dehydrogenase [Solirubrobacterales bacterium]|nr:PQQ-dependent sugar dehydrogenase [Solirubrobacterales bacterium]